jgi:hypothetical protein
VQSKYYESKQNVVIPLAEVTEEIITKEFSQYKPQESRK